MDARVVFVAINYENKVDYCRDGAGVKVETRE